MNTLNVEGNETYIDYADAINRLLDINKQMPEEKRIRVISISWSPGSDESIDGYEETVKAYERAQAYPQITYEAFSDALRSTADTVHVDNLGESVPIMLVNPSKLVTFFQEQR